MILVLSENTDFAEVVQAHIAHEIKHACKTVPTMQAAQPYLHEVVLIVTDGAKPDMEIPVITPATRPFRLRQLLDGIREQLKDTHNPDKVPLGKSYTLLPRMKQLCHISGSTADLTDKELQILLSLEQAGGKGLDREALLKRVWQIESGINTHTLETHIYRLRAKLRELADDDSLIAAVEGTYRLEYPA